MNLMRQTYCRSIGAQFMHIDDYDVRQWLQKRMEGTRNRMHLHRDTQVRILTRLTDAVIFEEFVRRKFVGAKTFSLEGSETLIPLLDLALEKAGDHGVKDVVLGMAHRGTIECAGQYHGQTCEKYFLGFRRSRSRNESRWWRCAVPHGLQQRLDNQQGQVHSYLALLQSQSP